jgi:hypothetical protein
MEKINEKVYVDTNIFLNAILYDPYENQDAQRASEFLDTIKQDKVQAMTSLLTWDELVWVIQKELGEDTARTKGREFLSFPHLHFIEVTIALIVKAQDILENHVVKPRDAIHLATAITSGASTFVTLDGRLKKVGIIPYYNLSTSEKT